MRRVLQIPPFQHCFSCVNTNATVIEGSSINRLDWMYAPRVIHIRSYSIRILLIVPTRFDACGELFPYDNVNPGIKDCRYSNQIEVPEQGTDRFLLI